MEGGKISDFRCGDWLNSSNLKKNESLSNYFLQLASTRNYLFQLEEIKFAAARFLLYNGKLERKMVQWTGFKLSDQGYSLSFVGAPSCHSKPPEAKRDTTSNRSVIVRMDA